MNNQPPRIDPRFKALMPPLSPEEYNQLEQNILASKKCRTPCGLSWPLVRLSCCGSRQRRTYVAEARRKKRVAIYPKTLMI